MTVLSCSCSYPENTESFHSFDTCPTPPHPSNIPEILCKTWRTDKRDERESCKTHRAQWPGQATMLSLVNSSKGTGKDREMMGGHRHSLVMLHCQKLQHTFLERREPRETAMFILNASIPPKEMLCTDIFTYC